MSRLIDADKLKEHFSDEDNQCGLQTIILNSIDLQPTAFDIDKVVAQLEALENAEVDYYSSNDVIDRIDAIDIVKKGGIDE